MLTPEREKEIRRYASNEPGGTVEAVEELLAEIDRLRHQCEKAERQVVDLHDDVKALQAYLIGQEHRLGTQIDILQSQLDLAVKALGQLKTITDDCQHMSRFAANEFDKIIDQALKQIRGEEC